MPMPVSIATTEIGSARLHYDAGYGRTDRDRWGGQLEQLNFAAQVPDFTPAGENLTAAPDTLAFVHLEAADRSLAPQERMAKLYARFLDERQAPVANGLVMRQFASDSPYGREDLYFTPPEGRVFTARCTRPARPPDGLPETCLFYLRVNGLDAQIRFSPVLLPQWEPLSAGARALIERIAR